MIHNPLKNILYNYTSHLKVSSSLNFENTTIQGFAAISPATNNDKNEKEEVLS